MSRFEAFQQPGNVRAALEWSFGRTALRGQTHDLTVADIRCRRGDWM